LNQLVDDIVCQRWKRQTGKVVWELLDIVCGRPKRGEAKDDEKNNHDGKHHWQIALRCQHPGCAAADKHLPGGDQAEYRHPTPVRQDPKQDEN